MILSFEWYYNTFSKGKCKHEYGLLLDLPQDLSGISFASLARWWPQMNHDRLWPPFLWETVVTSCYCSVYQLSHLSLTHTIPFLHLGIPRFHTSPYGGFRSQGMKSTIYRRIFHEIIHPAIKGYPHFPSWKPPFLHMPKIVPSRKDMAYVYADTQHRIVLETYLCLFYICIWIHRLELFRLD